MATLNKFIINKTSMKSTNEDALKPHNNKENGRSDRDSRKQRKAGKA